MTKLDGKKTYIISGAMLIYGILGAVLGYQDATSTGAIILEALALAGLRHGIANK